MKKTGKPTTDQRRAFVMSMRDAGLKYEEIAEEAIEKFGRENLPRGYCKRLVHLDIKRELNKKSPGKIKCEARRHLIFHYRKEGMRYNQIVEKLRQDLGKDDLPAGYNERHACRDMKRYLEKMKTENSEVMIESKILHRERLNFLLNTLWQKASQGDIQSIDRIIMISEAISKLDSENNVPRSTASPSKPEFNSVADITDYFSKLK